MTYGDEDQPIRRKPFLPIDVWKQRYRELRGMIQEISTEATLDPHGLALNIGRAEQYKNTVLARLRENLLGAVPVTFDQDIVEPNKLRASALSVPRDQLYNLDARVAHDERPTEACSYGKAK